MLVAQLRAGLSRKLVHNRGGSPGLGSQGLCRARLQACLLRVRIVDAAVEPPTPQHKQKPVLFFRLDKDFRALRPNLAQQAAQLPVFLRADPPRPPVRDNARLVHRAEIAPSRHVLRPQVEIDPQGREHSAPDLIAKGIVAEQGQMGGTAAGRQADPNRDMQAANTCLGQPVQVRNTGGLEFCLPVLRIRQPPQSVKDQQ